jgi:hypothetical protein
MKNSTYGNLKTSINKLDELITMKRQTMNLNGHTSAILKANMSLYRMHLIQKLVSISI